MNQTMFEWLWLEDGLLVKWRFVEWRIVNCWLKICYKILHKAKLGMDGLGGNLVDKTKDNMHKIIFRRDIYGHNYKSPIDRWTL